MIFLKQSIDYIAGRAEIEISGNVTKENIERIKNFGVNYVSSGALTHSAPILDISLKKFTCSLERTLTDERRDQESKNRKYFEIQRCACPWSYSGKKTWM